MNIALTFYPVAPGVGQSIPLTINHNVIHFVSDEYPIGKITHS